MSLTDSKNVFLRDAERIPEYNLLTPLELGNGYCDADESGDQLLRSSYWSALMLRYWYKIFAWKQNSSSLNLDDEEYIEWLYGALTDTFFYRSWRYEYEAVVKDGKFIEWKRDKNGNKIPNKHYWKIDPNAVDRTINYFCWVQRGMKYQYYNKDKRKNNAQALSIESVVDENGKQIECFGHTRNLEVSGAHELVELFLKSDKALEALVVDGIAYQDSFKTEGYSVHRVEIDSQGQETIKRYRASSESFNMRKLVKHLSTIDEKFIKDYFCSTYFLSERDSKDIMLKLSTMNNPKWYNCIKKTFEEIKSDKRLLSCLIDTN